MEVEEKLLESELSSACGWIRERPHKVDVGCWCTAIRVGLCICHQCSLPFCVIDNIYRPYRVMQFRALIANRQTPQHRPTCPRAMTDFTQRPRSPTSSPFALFRPSAPSADVETCVCHGLSQRLRPTPSTRPLDTTIDVTCH